MYFLVCFVCSGELTYLVMNATEPPSESTQDYLCNCTDALVSNMVFYSIDGTSLHRVTLNWSAGDQFPVSTVAPFRAPTTPFFIKTTGTDENGFTFQRISRTIVPGKAGPPVYIPVDKTVFWQDERKALILPCPYRSVASVTVTWKKLHLKGTVVLQGSAYVTAPDGRLLIKSTILDDAGQYQCQIKSSEGVAEGQELKVNIASKVTYN